jgi:hypothetical protein
MTDVKALADGLVAVPLLVLLAVGILLIAPGEPTPEAAPDAPPSFASAQHLHRAGAVVEKGRAL